MLKISNLLLFVIILSINFSASTLQGQSKESNLEKYWKYRSEMVSKFMKVGDGQGESLPAARIDSADRFIKWADQTIYLGWYIGALATEFHLITDSKYIDYADDSITAIQQNLNELYYALYALKRLDSTAEEFFLPNCDPVDTSTNGFFIRDDVPIGFESNFNGMDTIISDYTIAGPEVNEMSQDQAYHLFLGLSLVKKFIPKTLEVQGVNLHELALNETKLIGRWIEKNNWTIRNPGCNNREVDRGGNAYFFGKGTNEVVEYITEGELSFASSIDGTQQIVWPGLSSPSHPTYQNKDNLHMAMVISATGKGWGNSTFSDLMELAKMHDFYLYPLLSSVLHNTNEFTDYESKKGSLVVKVEAMLDSAPKRGIYSPIPDTNSHGWGIGRKFTASKHMQYQGKQGHQGNQYNAIDYQLLHNLFYIAFPQEWDSTITTIDQVKTSTYSVKIIPNPSKGNFEIIISAKELQSYSVELYNINGQLIYRKNLPFGQKKLIVNGSELDKGVYLIKLISDQDGKVVTKKLIKSR